MKYYLAYGSNLNVEQMKYRCPDAVPAGTCMLNNWELVFRRGVLTIEPKPGSFVPVGIWKICEADEKSLDRYEGFPRLYYKQPFPILLTGYKDMDDFKAGKKAATEKVGEAMAYIMTDGFPIEEPSFAYMRTVQQGYKDFGFDTAPLMKAYRNAKGGGR
ncbi:MAG: gamma-glutamylcyclotransferase [Clostridia bacterium]|nr:gamma-glutamylcyclotransferase [Clostridia bacterium]